MEPQNEFPPITPDGHNPVVTQEPGFGAKLLLTFFDPVKLFDSLKRQANWWQPLVMFVLISLIAGYIAQPHIVPSMKQDTLDFLSQIPNIPDQTIQTTSDSFDEAAKITPFGVIKGTLGAVLFRGILFFVVTSLLFFIGSIFFGGTAKYIKVMSFYAWVYPIWALGIIITTPLMIIKETYKVSLSPALLMTPDNSNSLYFLMKNFSVFNIWAIILIGIGFSVIYGVGRAKAIIAVIVLWGIWIAINSFIPYLNFQASMMGLT